jgi:hypothetical protein
VLSRDPNGSAVGHDLIGPIVEPWTGSVRDGEEWTVERSSRNRRRIGSQFLAFLAVQMGAQMLLTACDGEYPGAIDEGGLMPYVLPMTTGQIGHPIAVFVLVIPNDRLLHGTTMLVLQMESG